MQLPSKTLSPFIKGAGSVSCPPTLQVSFSAGFLPFYTYLGGLLGLTRGYCGNRIERTTSCADCPARIFHTCAELKPATWGMFGPTL